MKTSTRLLALALLGATRIAHAGGAGTLTLDSGPLTYTGGPVWVDNPTTQVGAGQCFDGTVTCDVFTLTVDLLADYETLHPYGLVVASIAWPTRVNDFELFVLDADGNAVAGNSSSNDPETVTFPALAGQHIYQVITYPNIAPPGDIVTGAIRLVDAEAPYAQPGPRLSFVDHKPPEGVAQSAGEPTLDVNPNTGAVLFLAELSTFKVAFDDAQPGVSTWEDVSSPFSVTTLDPILTGDAYTGRIFVSQLLGVTSLLSFTDDDGATWLPSEGSGIPGGVDHQSLGAGPYPPAFAFLAQNPLYPDPLYYCSQDLFTALCARSDDGGITFAPPVPMYTTECAGIHGHVKVAADGTVYVPNKSCFVNGDSGQAVIVSEDAGLTWHIRMIPDTESTQGSDPSVVVGSDGTVYFGYQSVEGRARIAVSRDRGLTWDSDHDVSAPVDVRNVVFPAVAAGDGDRAVFVFHGSTAKGVGYTESYEGIWHLYAATTFDGGAHWVTQNVTPTDPVQREGGICLGGIGCSGNNRNLLDFMDVVADAEGRIVIGYADGCVGECLTGGENTFARVGSIVRQTAGPRLYSAFDPAGTVVSYEPEVPGGGTTPPPVAVADNTRFGGALGLDLLAFFGTLFLLRRPRRWLAVLAIGASSSALASTPSSGMITPATPTLGYVAGPFAISNITFVGNSTPPASCSTTEPCDEFRLTIDLPENYLDQHPSDQIRFVFTWGDPVEDFDVFLYDLDNNLAFVAANSPGPGAPESFALPAYGGKREYVIRILPSVVAGGTVAASIALTSIAPSTNVTEGGIEMQNFAAPDELDGDTGEPTLAVNPATNRTLFLSGLNTLRAEFDDSTQPTTATWTDVSTFFTSITTSDPILAGDRNGRIFVAQFVVGEGQSMGAFTDDDGETWTNALFGAEVRSGLDHQTMGMGPYPSGFPLPHPLYDQAIYYCSQDLVTAECSRSDDGGLTFPVGVPIFGLGGGSIHGHVKVARDGTAYVPARLTPLQNGVAVSEDGGLTWQVRVVPNTIMGRWDPSIGIGADGTIYFGYANLGDDRPRIVVSRDKGRTWTDDTDVGRPLHIVNSVFAAVVAGDDDRAAYAFLGSEEFGDSNVREFPGDWFLYVATTLDGGKSWKLVNASPGHPVQRGGICSNGIVCSGSPSYRNLLDFMDATMDNEGRILVGYADGCVDECDTDPSAENSFTAHATIARQVSGPRLLAAFDPPVVVPPVTPPPTVTPASESRFGGALPLPLLLALAAAAAFTRRRRAAGSPRSPTAAS